MSRSWVRRVLVAATTGVVATAALTLAGVTGVAAAAPATQLSSSVAMAPAAGDAGEFDIFNESNFQGGFANLTNSTINDLSTVNLNDLVSSAVNNSNTKMCLFTDANFKGQAIVFPPHTQISQFAASIDNSASSVKPC